MSKTKVGIVGGAGYVGGEMFRLLMNHPKCEIAFVSSRSQEGEFVYSAHPDLKGWTDMVFTKPDTDVDVLFLCMGHGNSRSFVEQLNNFNDKVIIDLSRDYRLTKDSGSFIYGLCELNKTDIKSASRIANPGCFATCIQLGLLPMAKENLLLSDVHVTAITGSTGAGQKPVGTTHNSWRNNNISIYKAFTHQHLDEILQSVNQLQSNFAHKVHFIPMRGSFTRGIFANMYFDTNISAEEATETYKSFYKDSPFVHISSDPISVKEITNTSFLQTSSI